MRRPSGRSVRTPNAPIVYAIAPKAPIGATRMMKSTMRKNTSSVVSSTPVSGAAPLPSATMAKPNRIAKKTICRMSPCANASTGLDGTMCVTKSVNFIDCPATAYCETSPLGRTFASRPAPGFATLTTVSPIARANVVTISK